MPKFTALAVERALTRWSQTRFEVNSKGVCQDVMPNAEQSYDEAKHVLLLTMGQPHRFA